MSILHVTIGLPGSGKSFWAKEFSNEVYKNICYLSSDKLRLELFGNEDEQNKNEELFNELYKRAEVALNNGVNVIIDSTNLSVKRRIVLIDRFKKSATKIVAHYFDTPLEDCLERNDNRNRKVPVSVIENMYVTMQVPYKYEGWDNIIIHHEDGIPYDDKLFDLFYCMEFYHEYTELMSKNKLLYFPIFQNIYELGQDSPWHSLTVSRHTYFVWDYIRKNYHGLKRNRDYMLLTAFLHDTGKRFTKKFKRLEDGTINRYANFLGHENVSAQLACNFLKNFGLSDEYVLDVVFLVQNHMKLLQIGESEKGLKKFREFVGENFYELLVFFREADVSAK